MAYYRSAESSGFVLIADLVTLSACNTGVGKLEGEEGITNLVEAFLVSGAKAVIASLWSADDIYTSALMGRFYTHIAEGRTRPPRCATQRLICLAKYGRQVPPLLLGRLLSWSETAALRYLWGPMSLDSRTKERFIPASVSL